MSPRIGILGGTFDPIHLGHVDVGIAVERALRLTDVQVVPSHVPPHRPETFASPFHRFAMVTLAAMAHPAWRASDVELRRGGPSYTSATLRYFHGQGHPAATLYFIVGADAFGDVTTWMDYPAILDMAHFAVVSRPGWPVADLPARLPELASRMLTIDRLDASPERLSILLIDAPTADVSSTAIRERRARGESVAGLVVASVEQHIDRHQLYLRMTGPTQISEYAAEPAAGRLHG